MSKIINSKSKWLIECDFFGYKVGDSCGTIPNNCDCIIEGWHFKNGVIVKYGIIRFIPGERNYIIRNNIIENV